MKITRRAVERRGGSVQSDLDPLQDLKEQAPEAVKYLAAIQEALSKDTSKKPRTYRFDIERDGQQRIRSIVATPE